MIFEEGKERNRALGIWSAITAGGAALGLILGGVLTEYASWRWVLFVNVPIAAVAIIGAIALRAGEPRRARAGLRHPGAVLVTGGLMALVFALVKGNEYGWGSVQDLGMLALAAVLLVAFVVGAAAGRTTRSCRSGSSDPHAWRAPTSARCFIGAGIFAMFFFLILWMQAINGWSPVKAGLSRSCR